MAHMGARSGPFVTRQGPEIWNPRRKHRPQQTDGYRPPNQGAYRSTVHCPVDSVRRRFKGREFPQADAFRRTLDEDAAVRAER